MKNKITKLFLVLMLSGFASNAQTDKERQQIISKTDVSFLENLTKELEIRNSENLKAATEKALRLGYPLEGVEPDGSFYQLVGFYEGTTDLKYYKTHNKQDYNALMYNNNGPASSLNTSKATYLHDNNILGQGMIAGEWDGGSPLLTHFAIAGRVTLRDNGATPVNGSVGHATHVAGTIISSGEGAPGLEATKGFLPKARLWAANWDNDNSEMSAAAAAGLLFSNHSYGPNPSQGGFSRSMFGQYNSESRLFDQMSNANPFYTIVVAAGNDRDSYTTHQPSKGGRDLLTTMGVSKNLVTVAAINGISNYVNANSVIMSSFSNWGPTDDYRIKPDISAKGVNVLSIYSTGSSSIETLSGTSMAAPAVTGGIGLWQQYYNSLFSSYMLSSTVRAMLAHTALEAGPAAGPDHMFGWGVMNVEAGAKLMDDYAASKAWILQQELNNGNFFSNTFEYDGVSELKATLGWNDPAGAATSGNDERFPRLVNDLDLRIINDDTQEEFLPWRLAKSDTSTGSGIALLGDNNVDNIEKVEVKNAPAGNYRVVVSHKGTLTGGKQMYSLLLSGSGTTLSAKEHLFNDVKVFPNPTQNVLNVSLPKEIAFGVTYDIYDVSGKKVKQHYNKVDSNNLTVDVSGLTSGVYVLTVKTTEGSSNYKFVKK